MGYGQVAAALGVSESSVLFVEPDLPQSFPDQNETNRGGSPFAVAEQQCVFADQHNDSRKIGAGFGWHLDDNFSQLRLARNSVQFSDRRTLIAHIDTGYDPNHTARPARIRHDLEQNFVSEDGTPNNAADPGRDRLFDNSGHGTGTSGLLAGQSSAQKGPEPIGGAQTPISFRSGSQIPLFFFSRARSPRQFSTPYRRRVMSFPSAWADYLRQHGMRPLMPPMKLVSALWQPQEIALVDYLPQTWSTRLVITGRLLPAE